MGITWMVLLWDNLSFIFVATSAVALAWLLRCLPALLDTSSASRALSGALYFAAGCACTVASICAAVVLLFLSITAKHNPAPPPAFPASAPAGPKRQSKAQRKKQYQLQQQHWLAATKPQPAIYLAGRLQGQLWTIPISAWPRDRLPPDYPPVSEGPGAISHKWDATLSNGMLTLSLFGPQDPNSDLTKVDIPLAGCSCNIVWESLVKPDGKRMGPWHKRAPLELSHPTNSLLYGERSVFIFAETGVAKEQWHLALVSESTPDGAQAKTRASYQTFCTHMTRAAERLVLPQPPILPVKALETPPPQASASSSDNQQKQAKTGKRIGFGWIMRLVPGRRGKPSQQQQQQQQQASLSATQSAQDLQQQALLQAQQQEQVQTLVSDAIPPAPRDRADADEQRPTEGQALVADPAASGGQPAEVAEFKISKFDDEREAGPSSAAASLTAMSSLEVPKAAEPSSFDLRCPSKVSEESLSFSRAVSSGRDAVSTGAPCPTGGTMPHPLQDESTEASAAPASPTRTSWHGGGGPLQMPIMPLTMDWPVLPTSELPLQLQEQEAPSASNAPAGSSRGLSASSSAHDLRQPPAPLSYSCSFEDLDKLVQCRSPTSSISGKSDTGHEHWKQDAKQAAREEQRRRDEVRRQESQRQQQQQQQQQQAVKRAAKEAAERQKQQQREEATKLKLMKQETRRKQEEQAKLRKEQEQEQELARLNQTAQDAASSADARQQPGARLRIPPGLEAASSEAHEKHAADAGTVPGAAASAPGPADVDPGRGQVVSGLLGLNMLLTRIGFEVLGAQRLERWLHRVVQRKLDEFKRPAYLHPLQLVTLDLGSSFPLLRELRAVAGSGGDACVFPQLVADVAFSGRVTLVVSTSVELQQAGLIKKLQAAFGRMAGIQGDQGAAAEQLQSAKPSSDDVRGAGEKLGDRPASTSGTFAQEDDAPQQRQHSSRSAGGAQVPPLGRQASLPSGISSSDSLQLADEKRLGEDTSGQPAGSAEAASELSRRASDVPPAPGSSGGGGGNLFSGLLSLSRAAAAKAGSLAAGFTESLPRVPCQLEICVTRLECELMVWASPPPSDRLWLCFAAPPSVDISTRPLFGNRILRYSAILSQVSALLKAKILKAINRTLVYPAAADIKLGFFANPGVTNEPQPATVNVTAPAPQPTTTHNAEPVDLQADVASSSQGALSEMPGNTEPSASDLVPPPAERVLPLPSGLTLNAALPPRHSQSRPSLSASSSVLALGDLESAKASAPATPRSSSSKPSSVSAPAAPAPAPSNARKGLSLAFRFRPFGRKSHAASAEVKPPAVATQQPSRVTSANAIMESQQNVQPSDKAYGTQPSSKANSTQANSARTSLDLPAPRPPTQEPELVAPSPAVAGMNDMKPVSLPPDSNVAIAEAM